MTSPAFTITCEECGLAAPEHVHQHGGTWPCDCPGYVNVTDLLGSRREIVGALTERVPA